MLRDGFFCDSRSFVHYGRISPRKGLRIAPCFSFTSECCCTFSPDRRFRKFPDRTAESRFHRRLPSCRRRPFVFNGPRDSHLFPRQCPRQDCFGNVRARGSAAVGDDGARPGEGLFRAPGSLFPFLLFLRSRSSAEFRPDLRGSSSAGRRHCPSGAEGRSCRFPEIPSFAEECHAFSDFSTIGCFFHLACLDCL